MAYGNLNFETWTGKLLASSHLNRLENVLPHLDMKFKNGEIGKKIVSNCRVQIHIKILGYKAV